MPKKPRLSAATLGSAVLMAIGKVFDMFFFQILPIPTDVWLAVAVGLFIIGVFLFPYKSFRKPVEFLTVNINDIDFKGVFDLEPNIEVTFEMTNKSDIEQTVKCLQGMLVYSASERDVFPQYPLQHSFCHLEPTSLRAKDKVLVSIVIPIAEGTAKRTKAYMEHGQYIFWTGKVGLNVSAKVWGIERGQFVKVEIPQFPVVPRGIRMKATDEL